MKYLKTVLKHKYYVFLACLHFQVPILSALSHDWDKFLPDEFFPYKKYFSVDRRNSEGTYVRNPDEDLAFDFAWLLHQKRNRHHWQWWMLPKDDGSTQLFEMSDKDRKEMLADWFGAGRTYVTSWSASSPLEWYEKSKDRMQLHPKTRQWVEDRLHEYHYPKGF